MSREAPPVISTVWVTPASGPGGTRFRAEVITADSPAIRIAYQWLLDGDEIPGATGASHIGSAAGVLTVRATVTNAFGADSYVSAPIFVGPGLFLPEILDARVVPETGGIGTRFTIALAAAGVPAPALAYQWLLDGREIIGATSASHVAYAPGNLSVRVVARNTEGSDQRETATVAVSPGATAPAVTSALIQPSTGRATATQFTALAETAGEPAPALSYQWLLDNAPIAGATGISHVAAVEGVLSVLITAVNAGGSHSLASDGVTVKPAVSPPQVRAADILPNAGSVGDTFKVTVTTCGYPEPQLRYQWFLDDRLLQEPSGDTYTSSVPGTIYVRITATSSEGEDSRESGAVLIEPALAPPALSDVSVTPSAGRVGDRFEVAAIATGHPTPELDYQWFSDGAPIAGAKEAYHTAGTPGILRIDVTARNEFGADTMSSSDIVVAPGLAAPVVETVVIEPTAGRVGDVFLASATATGAPAPVMTYQWLRDGVPIEGSTGASHLAMLPSRLSVQVTATNAAGTDRRESDAVTVEPRLAAPAIEALGISPEIGRVGDTFSLVPTITGNPPPTIRCQWLLNGEEIRGASDNQLVAASAGRLSVRVSAENPQGFAELESISAIVTAAETLLVFRTGVFEEGVFL